MSIYTFVSYRKQRRALVDKIRGSGRNPALQQAPEDSLEEQSFIKKRIIRMMAQIGQRVRPGESLTPSHMRQQFLKAGYRRGNAPVIFLGVKVMLSMLLPSLFFAYRILFIRNFAAVPVVAVSVLLALIGFYLPHFYLNLRIGSRKEKILQGFPDALDLMVVCVEAGMGLDAAIQRVGEEMRLSNGVVAEEFRILSLELRAGKPRREALRNLATRTDLEDISSLMSLLIQTDKFGTSVAEALRVHGDSMRTRRYQKAEEVAAKIPIKLLFPLIIFIFPSLFLVLLGPAVIQIFRTLLPALNG
jgi:tight adherence protein C